MLKSDNVKHRCVVCHDCNSNPPAAECAERRICVVCCDRDPTKRQAAARVALLSILKVSTKMKNHFIGKKLTVHEVSYPEKSDMSRSDMLDSTVVYQNNHTLMFNNIAAILIKNHQVFL